MICGLGDSRLRERERGRDIELRGIEKEREEDVYEREKK